MPIDKDFLYLDDTQEHSDDPYGDRWVLTLDSLAPLVPGSPLSIRGTLKLDGQRMPMVEFPDDPMNSRERIRSAIAAAVVIEDVEEDLDRLQGFEVRQETAEAFGGHLDTELAPGTYALRLVARTPHPNPGRSTLSHLVRVARAVFTVGGTISQEGLEPVWLVEELRPPQQQRFLEANLRLFGPEGERALVEGAVLHVAERLPLSHPFEKRAIAIAPEEEGSLYFLSPQDDGTSRHFEAQSDGTFSFFEAFPFDSQIFSKSFSHESWVWDGRRIGRYFGNALVKAFDRYMKVFAIAGVRDSTFWTVCGTRRGAAEGPVHLRRVDENGTEIALVPTVSAANQELGAILRVMADGGVLAYGNYRSQGPHVVRVASGGNTVAVSAPYPSNVLDVAVNPFTGEALVVRAHQGRRIELVRLDPGLREKETLRPEDTRFGDELEAFHSAEISAPPSGQRIWISGQRKERQPSGVVDIRGAVGFLDADGIFTLVHGGMEKRSLVRALW